MTARHALVLCLALLLAAPSALAHANYYTSEPRRGARLAQAPSEVSVTLSETIDPAGSSLEVRDQAGRRVDEGPVRYRGGATPVLTISLRPDLGPGAYQAGWRALSTVDGHVTSGTFGFAVGGFEPPADRPPESDVNPVSALSRTVAYAGYALAFGAVAFAMYVEPARPTTRLGRRYGTWAAVGGTLILLGVAGVTLRTQAELGIGWAGFVATDVGMRLFLRLAAAALTLAVGLWAWRRGLRMPTAAALVAFLALDAWGTSAFVHSANQGWHAVALDWVHLVCAAVWLGSLGLFLFHVLDQRRRGTYDEVLRVGRRFSGLAVVSVAALGATGVASTFLILGREALLDPASLGRSPYGTFLVGKVLLFGAMLALAGVNRFLFLQAGPGSRRRGLLERLFPSGRDRTRAFGRTVALEASFGVVVLVLAGFLTSTSPPYGSAPAQAPQLLALGDAYQAAIRFSGPPKVGGTSNVTLLIQDVATGEPLEEAIRVRVRIAPSGDNASAGETYEAVHDERGVWAVGEVLFPREGAHEVVVTVQTEAVYLDELRAVFQVRGGASS